MGYFQEIFIFELLFNTKTNKLNLLKFYYKWKIL